MMYRCDNCGIIRERDELPDVTDIAKRMDVGSPYTDKECLECGALCYRLPGIKMRWAKRGTHIHVTLFMGKDVEHMANCGTIIVRPKEFERLKHALSSVSDSETNPCELLVEEVKDVVDLS